MEAGDDWDAKDIGTNFASNPDVQPQYKLFIIELDKLQPAFGDGVRRVTGAMRTLRKLLKTMVSAFAKATPNTFLPQTLSVQWKYLCNKHLLGCSLMKPYKPAHIMTHAEKVEKEELTFSFKQIRKCINYQVNKYNGQISRCLVQASKKDSGRQSYDYINGDDNCYQSGDEDDEDIADEESDEEEGKISSRMPDSSIRSYQSQK